MTTAFVEDFDRIPMSQALASTLARAAEYASSQAHVEVTLEHLLLALTEDADAEIVLATSNVDVAQLKSDVASQLGRIEERLPLDQNSTARVSDSVRRILEAAAQAAQGRRNEINGAIVLAAIVGDGNSTAANLLRIQGLTFEEAIRALQTTLAKQNPNTSQPKQPPEPAKPPRTGSSAEDFLAQAREKVQSRSTTGRPGPRTTHDDKQLEEAQAETGTTTTQPPPPPDRTQDISPEQPVTKEPQTAQTPPPAPPRPPASQNPSTTTTGAPPRPRRPQNENTGAPGSWAPPRPQQPPTPQPAQRPMPPPPPLPADAAGAPPSRPQAPYPAPAGEGQYQSYARPDAAPAAPRGPLPQGMPPRVATAPPGAPPSRPPWPAPEQQHQPTPTPHPQQQHPSPSRAQRRIGMGDNGPGADPRRTQQPVVEAGQLVENIPRTMQVDVPTQAEISIAAAHINDLAGTLQGPAPAHRHDLTITKAMSVRLRAPDGGFFIETASPETQWIDRSFGIDADDYARWRWNVTPKSRGRKRLQLIVSARTVGADGLAAETALPDQVIEVKIRANYKKAAKSLTGWTIAAVAGGLLARFGENIWETGRLFVQQITSGG